MVLEGPEFIKYCVINMIKIARWRMHRELTCLCFKTLLVFRLEYLIETDFFCRLGWERLLSLRNISHVTSHNVTTSTIMIKLAFSSYYCVRTLIHCMLSISCSYPFLMGSQMRKM